MERLKSPGFIAVAVFLVLIAWFYKDRLSMPDMPSFKPSLNSEQFDIPSEPNYTVQEGDTIWWLALQCGCMVKDLKELNGLESDDIYVGQPLKLPARRDKPISTDDSAGAGNPEFPNTYVHVVQPGDTLAKIAFWYGTDVPTIQRLNPGISNPNLIRSGQHITVPPARAVTGPDSK